MKKLELKDWLELIRACNALQQRFDAAVATAHDQQQHEGALEELESARKHLAATVMDISPGYCTCSDKNPNGCYRLIAEGHPQDVRVHRICGDDMPWPAKASEKRNVPESIICTVCGEHDLVLLVEKHDRVDKPDVTNCPGSHTSNFKVQGA